MTRDLSLSSPSMLERNCSIKDSTTRPCCHLQHHYGRTRERLLTKFAAIGPFDPEAKPPRRHTPPKPPAPLPYWCGPAHNRRFGHRFGGHLGRNIPRRSRCKISFEICHHDRFPITGFTPTCAVGGDSTALGGRDRIVVVGCPRLGWRRRLHPAGRLHRQPRAGASLRAGGDLCLLRRRVRNTGLWPASTAQRGIAGPRSRRLHVRRLDSRRRFVTKVQKFWAARSSTVTQPIWSNGAQ